MKKLSCIVVVFFVFSVMAFSQSVPKFGEAVLFSNKEEVKLLMKKNGFREVAVKSIRSERLGNALCDVISGTSEWCQMCHVYFKKGDSRPSFVVINLVAYSSDYAASLAWKDAGYAVFKSLPSEFTHMLVKDREGQKYSFVAKVQILSTSDGTIVNATLQKISTPK